MSIYRRRFKGPDGTTTKATRHTVKVRDHLGRVLIVPGHKEIATSRALETKLRSLAALRATNTAPDAAMRKWIENLAPDLRDRLAAVSMITPEQVAGLRSLEDLRGDWEKHLRAQGRAERHVRTSVAACKRVLEGIGAKHWSSIDATKVETFLRGERQKDEKPIGARASNFLLGAVRGFCRWCVRTGLASEDPLRILKPLNVAEDRRRERRALTPEELAKLLKAAAEGPAIDGMRGPTRALLYRIAAETGLRRGELLGLTVADLDVADKEAASVRVCAAHAKNGRDARLPLRPGTATALAAHVKRRTPLAKVFDVSKHWRAFDAIQADLAKAKVAYRDAAGRVADFHALRVTFGTNLARAGVGLALAQRLMRHSDPRLTSNVYTVLSHGDDRAAIESLPDIATPKTAVATGTDGASHCHTHCTMDAGKRGKSRDKAGLKSERANRAEAPQTGGSQADSQWHARRDSNPQPADPKSAALSN